MRTIQSTSRPKHVRPSKYVDNVITSSRKYGLTLNVKKTKYMIVTKTEVPNEDLYVEGEKLEKV